MIDPQTFNRYAYCRNNPVNSTDPTGMAAMGVMSQPSGERANSMRASVESLHDELEDKSTAWAAGVQEALDAAAQAQSLNQAIANGDLTSQQAADIAANNPNLAVEHELEHAGSQQDSSQDPENLHFARVFSDGGTAIAAGTGFEPTGLKDPGRSGQNRGHGTASGNTMGHLNGFAIHIYNKGTPGTSSVNLYVPPGFDSNTQPGPSDAAVQFHYKELNGVKDVVLVVFHVAQFRIQRHLKNEMGSIKIGMSGGKGGGENKAYMHSCIQAFSGSSMPAKYEDRSAVRLSVRQLFKQ